jgi:hypothetical protein
VKTSVVSGEWFPVTQHLIAHKCINVVKLYDEVKETIENNCPFVATGRGCHFLYEEWHTWVQCQ